MRQFRELSRFLLYFFIGIIIGTVISNGTVHWFGKIPKLVEHYIAYREGISAQAWEIRFWHTVPLRLVIPLILWLIGKSSGAKQWFLLITVAAGIFLSAWITWITCLYGWKGIFIFFQLTLPQWIGYAPIWCVLTWGNGGKGQTFQNRELIFLIGWYLAGLLGEVLINPFLMNIF